ncbi:hypothetical protein [Sphingomonas canadensis]|nr:hypothetical protein [Sphingomonas canadensis]
MTNIRAFAVIPAVFLSTAVLAQTDAPRAGAPAVIDYTSLDGLFREFVATPDGSALYLRDRKNQWYLARFASRCEAASRAAILGFERSGDRRIAAGTRVTFSREAGMAECRISDLRYSASPAAGLRRGARAADGGAMRVASLPGSDPGMRQNPRGVTLR